MSPRPPIFSNQSREDLAEFVDGARGFELNTSKEGALKAFNEKMEINFRKLWQWRFNVDVILSAARRAKAIVSPCRPGSGNSPLPPAAISEIRRFLYYILKENFITHQSYTLLEINMNECESLLKATIYEMEKLLTSKTVVAEPVTWEGKTVVPLLSVSVGFGAGAGPAKEGEAATGGGAGGGFKMKPVAVIVIEKDQVKVESLVKNRDTKYPFIESVLEKIPQILKRELKEREDKGETANKEAEKKDTEIRIE